MSLITELIQGRDLVKTVGSRLEKLATTDEDRQEQATEQVKADTDLRLELARLEHDQQMAQIQINREEAKSGNWFVAGWRPAIGWIGALALLYQFVLYPLLLWLPVDKPPRPLDAGMLYPIIMGMLGIGTMRSFDKFKKIDTRQIGEKKPPMAKPGN